ncbi:MAG: polysaccharide biosynthesis C-terminal domain-containing protein, partial [Flavobacteriales bacterium]|nr:polysaccharide biosynthesis C-terminal domain-containing protein [Flavobacteriales bacterium]
TDEHNLLMKIALFSAIINLILNVWLIQLIGITGAAIATAIAATLNNALCVYFVKKKLGFYPFYLPYYK